MKLERQQKQYYSLKCDGISKAFLVYQEITMAAVVKHYSRPIVCLVLALHHENVKLILNHKVFWCGGIMPALLLFVQFTISPSFKHAICFKLCASHQKQKHLLDWMLICMDLFIKPILSFQYHANAKTYPDLKSKFPSVFLWQRSKWGSFRSLMEKYRSKNHCLF